MGSRQSSSRRPSVPELLQRPSAASELYLASAPEDVVPHRPLMTGDIFEDIEIPGLDGSGPATILTHPCSMRSDGVKLVRKLLLCRVVESDSIPLSEWPNGHFRVMPLPELLGGDHKVKFAELGLVDSKLVLSARRVACLSLEGVNLLQQRFIFFLSRSVSPTSVLNRTCAHVFEEAELQEDWIEKALSAGTSIDDGAQHFHDWIRSNDSSGSTRQECLEHPERRARIRRESKEAATAKYPTQG